LEEEEVYQLSPFVSVNGVGQVKLEKYGEVFSEFIRGHLGGE
jgi:hypothetical protein